MASLREDRHPWHSSTATLCDRRDWAAAALRVGGEHVANTDADSRNSLRTSAATHRSAFQDKMLPDVQPKSVINSSRQLRRETRQESTDFEPIAAVSAINSLVCRHTQRVLKTRQVSGTRMPSSSCGNAPATQRLCHVKFVISDANGYKFVLAAAS